VQYGWGRGLAPARNEGAAAAAIDRALACLGKPLQRRRQTGILAPAERDDAHTSSLSAIYGFQPFPMHSDTAHWATPARYLALYCWRAGGTPSETKLLDIASASLSSAERCLMEQAVFFVRNGRQSFYSSVVAPGRRYIRFDPGCMTPANPPAAAVVKMIARLRDSSASMALILQPGEILVLDNWRLLHARGRVEDPSRRMIRGLAT